MSAACWFASFFKYLFSSIKMLSFFLSSSMYWRLICKS